MNERDFFYWLQGFFEISETDTLSKKQVQVIKDHMALVATKVTPDRTQETSEDLERRLEDLLKPAHDSKVICSTTTQSHPFLDSLCANNSRIVCMRLADPDNCTCNLQECKADCQSCIDENVKYMSIRTNVTC